MSNPRPRQKRSEETTRDLMAAARTSFIEDGYAAATIDAIAARAGRTKGSVYHHVEDKQDLFRRVFIEEQRSLAVVVADAAGDDDPVDSLARGLAAYLELIGGAPDSANLTLVQAPRVLGWEQWRTCDGGPFRGMLASAIERIAGAGRLRSPIDHDVLADFILGAVTESALCIVRSVDPRSEAARHAAAIAHLVDDLTT